MHKLRLGLSIIGTIFAIYSAFILLINAFANIGGLDYQFTSGQLLIWVSGLLILFELGALWTTNRPYQITAGIVSLGTIITTIYVQLRVFDVPDIETIIGVILFSLIIWLLLFLPD